MDEFDFQIKLSDAGPRGSVLPADVAMHPHRPVPLPESGELLIDPEIVLKAKGLG